MSYEVTNHMNSRIITKSVHCWIHVLDT